MSINDPTQVLKEKLGRFFLNMASIKLPKKRNENDVDSFIFHIIECFDDFKQVCELHDHPNYFSEKEVKKVMQGLIYHALPHLIAAARKYDYVADILE